MSADAPHRAPARRRLPTRVLLVCAAVGVATGALSLPIAYLHAATVAFGPLVACALVGVYPVPAGLGLALTRRPGAGLLTALIAGLVQVPLSPIGWGAVWSVVVWGALVELVFLVTRYRSWSLGTHVVAAAVSCAAGSVVVWFLFSFARLTVPVQLAAEGLQLLSGVVAGLLVALLAGRLVRAGVASGVRPAARPSGDAP